MNTFSTLALFVVSLSILLTNIDVEAKKHNLRQKSHSNTTKRSMNTAHQRYLPTTKRTPKVLIWDLGGTLLTTDKLGMASHIGLTDFLWYPLLDGKYPQNIQDKVFDVLGGLVTCGKTILSLGANSPDGRMLPAVMCDWLAGKERGDSITKRAHAHINDLEKNNQFYFSSTREKRLVENTIDAMFDPKILAKNTKIIKPAVRLLENCYRQLDHTGKPLHRMLVLSNWDSISFTNLYHSDQGNKIFKYFKPEDIIISGDIQLIKPDTALFRYMIDAHKLNPQDCIFIDDQAENCAAAKKVGMDAILLTNGDYGTLKRQLDMRGVF